VTATGDLPRAHRGLIDDLRAALVAQGDPERAVRMQTYMKSAVPFHGVPAPAVAAIERDVFPRHPLADYDTWRDTVLALFREGGHREEWYAAVALADHRHYRAHAREQRALEVYEELVVTAAWWDVVDTVAGHLLGGLHAAHPAWMALEMRAWASDASMWKRRAAILSQLQRKDETDLRLLYACIEANLPGTAVGGEFFIQKAIGWALRQVAWRDPGGVVRYVEANRERLSRLSKREALKNVLKSGEISAIP